MVNGLNYLNYIELSLILSVFSLLFRKFIIRKIIDIILYLIKKIKNKNIKDKEVSGIKDKETKVSLNQARKNLDKDSDFIFVFRFICFYFVYKDLF
jgi:hypothetical protein